MLKKDRKRFLRHGILVPESGQGRSGSHRALVHDLAGVPQDPNDRVEQDFIREVQQSNAESILISSEFMWPLLGVRAQAERLIGSLGSLDLDVVLVVYVRNQPQYLNSSYVQSVQTWLRADDFPAFARRARTHQGKYSYSHWISFAERHHAALLARPFCESVRKDGVTRDFLATIGVSAIEGFDTAIERNVSPGPFSVEVARSLLRRIGGPKNLTRAQAEQCRAAFRSQLKKLPVEDRGYCGLTTSFAAEVEAQFAEDNARFSRFAWGRPWHEVLASDVGQSFEPNDYSVTGVPADRRQLLGEVLDRLEPEIDAIMSGSLRGGSRRKRWRFSGLRSLFPL
jgi:hypothetical protein